MIAAPLTEDDLVIRPEHRSTLIAWLQTKHRPPRYTVVVRMHRGATANTYRIEQRLDGKPRYRKSGDTRVALALPITEAEYLELQDDTEYWLDTGECLYPTKRLLAQATAAPIRELRDITQSTRETEGPITKTTTDERTPTDQEPERRAGSGFLLAPGGREQVYPGRTGPDGPGGRAVPDERERQGRLEQRGTAGPGAPAEVAVAGATVHQGPAGQGQPRRPPGEHLPQGPGGRMAQWHRPAVLNRPATIQELKHRAGAARDRLLATRVPAGFMPGPGQRVLDPGTWKATLLARLEGPPGEALWSAVCRAEQALVHLPPPEHEGPAGAE